MGCQRPWLAARGAIFEAVEPLVPVSEQQSVRTEGALSEVTWGSYAAHNCCHLPPSLDCRLSQASLKSVLAEPPALRLLLECFWKKQTPV